MGGEGPLGGRGARPLHGAGRGPHALDELTARLELHPRAARNFLDTLVALRFLDREGVHYRNTPVASIFLDRGKPETDVTGLLEIAGTWWYDSWRNLTKALRTGEPQIDVTAGESNSFEALYADPQRMEKFQRAMHGASLGATLALVDEFPWSKYRTVADIGSASGTMLRGLLGRHAHLRGVGFDLPPLAPAFHRAAARAGLSDRLTFSAGDFFTDPLPSADVLSFGHILHDWDLTTKRMLLAKAFDALPPGGAVIVYDAMIDPGRSENVFGLLLSLHVMMENPKAFAYTGAECLGWLADAGFCDGCVAHLSGPESMAIGFKPSTA
ncbi:methyltransferase [Pendulispora albinea]|uniref:Acetylserotonin O-methyltransferase n=1 Tax=Pendulispora albinea TaxID=2741071 RepID=A0ABZ2LSF9_9BACT